MNKQRFIVTIAVTLLLVSFLAVSSIVPRYSASNYFKTDDFKSRASEEIEQSKNSFLPVVDEEEVADALFITDDQINEHRYFYGDLDTQIGSIREQYEEDLQSKEVTKERKKELTDERDAKIDDIRKNFEDDDHIRQKLIENQAVRYVNAVEALREEAENASSGTFVYELVSEEGELTKGTVQNDALYEKKFTKDAPLLIELPTTVYDELGEIQVTPTWTKKQIVRYVGTVQLPKEAAQSNTVWGSMQMDHRANQITGVLFLAIGLTAVLFLATLSRRHTFFLEDFRGNGWFSKWPIDGLAGVVFLSSAFLFTMGDMYRYPVASMIQGILMKDYNRTLHFISNVTSSLFAVAVTFAVVYVWLRSIVLLYDRVKRRPDWEALWNETWASRFVTGCQRAFLKRSIGVQMFILLIGFFLAGIGFVIAFMEPFLFVLYAAAVLFLGLPALYVFVRRFGYLNEVFLATEAMAEGQNMNIPIKGKSPIAEHAHHLNHLQQGVERAMNDRAKSERLKTELITNVSHDLRTPLTSIITYTDLLKQPNLSEEDRAHYVDVIERKSERLKVLIEDLFEVSKMASGNMELHRSYLDMTQLVQQVLAERQDEIERAAQEVIVHLPEERLLAQIDGERMWRVIDNLLSNALKYSLEGTRIYIDLREEEGTLHFEVRNISREPMHWRNVDELFERFKRGDASRQTEGSGLGLAIAQSIVEMHDGTMVIDVDGDLFKVSIALPSNA